MAANPDDTARCDRDQRRKQIALAARELIAEKGFEGLRTRDIAEKVGINIATLHYHVPGKDALVELLTSSLRDEFVARRQRGLREDASPLERLRKEFDDYRDTLVNNPNLLLVTTELAERARRDEKVAAVVRPMHANWARQIAAIIDAGREDGSFRADTDPLAAAVVVIGAMVAARTNGLGIAFYDRVTAELERALVDRPEKESPT